MLSRRELATSRGIKRDIQQRGGGNRHLHLSSLTAAFKLLMSKKSSADFCDDWRGLVPGEVS